MKLGCLIGPLRAEIVHLVLVLVLGIQESGHAGPDWIELHRTNEGAKKKNKRKRNASESSQSVNETSMPLLLNRRPGRQSSSSVKGAAVCFEFFFFFSFCVRAGKEEARKRDNTYRTTSDMGLR